jgi:Protein of unknown function (DUF2490)
VAEMMRYLYSIILVGILAGFAAIPAIAQDDEDIQSWNDLQITVPFNKYLEGFTQLTMRFGKNVTRLNDGRYAFGLNIKPTKSLTITPFYWYIYMRNAAGVLRPENRFNLRVNYKFPIKKFDLSHRSTFEWRYRPAGNTWRYRPSLTIAKDIPKKYIPKAKFYITEEVFYDSATDKFSRSRFTAGITKTLNANWAVDLYYMRQNDGFAHPGDLNVMGTSWKLKF